MDFEMDNEFNDVTNIKVIGVGGGGGNAVNSMANNDFGRVQLIACLLYTSDAADE